MQRNYLLLAAMALSCSTALAQNDNKGEVISLLPDGVTLNVATERKMDKQKNLVVVGTPKKGYKAFFAASDAEHGEELWVTDGTKAGTHMVADIQTGAGSSSPAYLTRFNDKVVFSAVNDEGDREPWISDGTPEGTFQLADCYAVGDGDPQFFMQVNENKVVFAAIDDESAEYDPDNGAQHWVWVTDGTTDGTMRISDQVKFDINPKEQTNQDYKYARVGRRVFFRGDNPDNQFGTELCVSDGTEEGTYIVKDINYEVNQDALDKGLEGYTRDSAIDNFANYNNQYCFFKAWDPEHGNEWRASDGTADGTYVVWDQKPNIINGIGESGDTYGPSREVVFGRIWTRVATVEYGDELAGWHMTKDEKPVIYDVNDIAPTANNNAFVDPGCEFQGNYFFCAAHGFDAAQLETNWGGELWLYDGQNAPRVQMNFCPGVQCDWVKELTVAGGSLYWYNEANDNPTVYGNGLYRLDEANGTPVVCPQITDRGDAVHSLRNLGGLPIYCSATTNGLYVFNYHKTGWDGKSDMGMLEPIYDGVTDKTDPAYVDPYQAALTGVETVKAEAAGETTDVYTVEGVQVRAGVAADKATQGLQKGIYVVGGKKVVVR